MKGRCADCGKWRVLGYCDDWERRRKPVAHCLDCCKAATADGRGWREDVSEAEEARAAIPPDLRERMEAAERSNR